jgi:hypothetical protein
MGLVGIRARDGDELYQVAHHRDPIVLRGVDDHFINIGECFPPALTLPALDDDVRSQMIVDRDTLKLRLTSQALRAISLLVEISERT